MNHIFIAIGAGVSSGAMVLFLSHIAPRFGAGNFIRDLDRPHVFGKAITRREAHLLGIFVHLLLSGIFGGIYAALVAIDVFSGFFLLPLLGWGLLLTLVLGGVVLPLEGHGLFGVREDAWFPVDLLLTNVLWSLLFWWLMRVWLGFIFISS